MKAKKIWNTNVFPMSNIFFFAVLWSKKWMDLYCSHKQQKNKDVKNSELK